MKNIFFSVSICLSTVLFCHSAKNSTCETSSNFSENNNVNLFVESACLSDPGEVIYFDDFTTDKGLKSNYQDNIGTYYYKYFELSCTSPTDFGLLDLNKVINQKKDFQIEVTFQTIDNGPKSSFGGGVFWGKTDNSFEEFYFFMINEGHYSIGEYKNGKWNNSIKALTFLPNLKPSEFNKLSIRKIKGTYYFFINDKQVHTCPFTSFHGLDNTVCSGPSTMIRISKINISYLVPPYNDSNGNGSATENNDNESDRENITIDPVNTSISNPISSSLSEYIYNEIPAGVQLVRSEAEWLKLSPEKACCCYPEFNDENKSLGLLYNYKAYEKIVVLLSANNSGMKVCSKEQWKELIAKCNSDRNNINTLQLNSYPGYYDEDWYSPKDLFSGYWLDEHTLISFSNENYGEPMIDDNIINDETEDSYRQSLAAFSIRLSKSENNLCGEQKWLNEPLLERGKGNSIKFISNASDWDKQTELTACCAYLDFDFSNDKYGLVYNKLAYDQLLADKDEVLKNQGYRVATEKDWQALITCCTKQGSLANLYNCEGDNYDGFNLEPNGFYGDTGWTLPEFGMSYFWVGEKGTTTVYRFECETKSGYYSTNGRGKNGFMIRLVKITP